MKLIKLLFLRIMVLLIMFLNLVVVHSGHAACKPSNFVTEEELQSKVIVDDTKSVINSTLLHFAKLKTQLSVSLLDQIIPRLRSIHANMISLLKNSANPPFNSLRFYREENDKLDNQLIAVKELLNKNSVLLDEYSVSYMNTEQQLKVHYETFKNILLPSTNGYANSTSASKKTKTKRSANYSWNNCGGHFVFNTSNLASSTSIDYKSEMGLNEHEGCLWMISAGYSHVSQFQISLHSMGFIPTNSTFLSIGYFNSNNYTNEENFKWRKFHRASEVLEITAATSVVLVHFVSSPQVGISSSVPQGFRLSVKVIHRDPTIGNNLHGFYTGAGRHPRYSGQYNDDERTVIVVQPNVQPFTFQLLWWDFENSIRHDSLSIWAFDESFTWRKQDTLFTRRYFSYPKNYPVRSFAKARSDPIILLFQSDSTVRGTGFEWNVVV